LTRAAQLQAFLDQLVLQSKAAENAVYTGSVTTDKSTDGSLSPTLIRFDSMESLIDWLTRSFID